MINIGKEIKHRELYSVLVSDPYICKYMFIDLDNQKTEFTFYSKKDCFRIEKENGTINEFSVEELFSNKKISSYISAFLVLFIRSGFDKDKAMNEFLNQINSLKKDAKYALILNYCSNLKEKRVIYNGPAS